MEFVWSYLVPLVVAVGVLSAAMSACSGLIWLERRGLALVQERRGPNRIGPFGLGHVVADTLKILSKEDWVPPFADKVVFVLAPMSLMIATLISFAIIPFAQGWQLLDSDVSLLFFLAMSSLAAYAVMLAGWASNNKYSLIGSLRAASQLLSYEVFMGLALMGPVILAGSFRLQDIVEAQKVVPFIVYQPIGFILFFIAGLAETHRAPFDLVEADSELVAGFHTEYSGIKFGMFFLGEYLGVTLISSLISTLYFGGWSLPILPHFVNLPVWLGPLWFAMKTFFFILMFILVRAALPRPRPDQLLSFGWKLMFPLALLNLLLTGAAVLALDPV